MLGWHVETMRDMISIPGPQKQQNVNVANLASVRLISLLILSPLRASGYSSAGKSVLHWVNTDQCCICLLRNPDLATHVAAFQAQVHAPFARQCDKARLA